MDTDDAAAFHAGEQLIDRTRRLAEALRKLSPRRTKLRVRPSAEDITKLTLTFREINHVSSFFCAPSAIVPEEDVVLIHSRRNTLLLFFICQYSVLKLCL
jgi:hypothetical protein